MRLSLHTSPDKYLTDQIMITPFDEDVRRFDEDTLRQLYNHSKRMRSYIGPYDQAFKDWLTAESVAYYVCSEFWSNTNLNVISWLLQDECWVQASDILDDYLGTSTWSDELYSETAEQLQNELQEWVDGKVERYLLDIGAPYELLVNGDAETIAKTILTDMGVEYYHVTYLELFKEVLLDEAHDLECQNRTA